MPFSQYHIESFDITFIFLNIYELLWNPSSKTNIIFITLVLSCCLVWNAVTMLRCRTEFNETLVCRRLQISINGWTINDGWINHRYLRGGRSFWLRQKLRRNTSVHLFVRYFGSSLPENLNLNNISSEIRTALLALSQLSAQLSAFYILSIWNSGGKWQGFYVPENLTCL